MSDKLELADRCEKAAAPDRELDAAIGKAVGAEPFAICDTGNAPFFASFTASLDAAMTLVPGKDWEWSLEWESGSLLYHPDIEQYARAKIGDPMLRMEAEAATPALALCAAALRAQASGEPRHD